MFNQKGQIHIIILVALVVGFIIYANFSGPGAGKWFSGYKLNPETKNRSTSASKETKISAPVLSPTPVVPTPTAPDAISPKRSNPQPKDKSSLPAETRKITLGLETNERATCKYSAISGVHFDSMQDFFDQTNVTTSHSTLITTLSEGEQYKYFIKCADASGNKNTDDFIISFEVKLPEDKTPPVLSNPSHLGDIFPAGTREAVISISTNEQAVCRYSTNAGTSYSSMSGSFSYYDQTKKFHTKNITGLQDGKAYDFFVKCQDTAKNTNTGDVLISFSVGK